MASYNRVVLAGNITRDPEIRFTGQGVPVCSFGLAVNRVRSRDKEAVDFFDVSAWRELGENVANHKRKGDQFWSRGASSTVHGRPGTARRGARSTSWLTASSSSAATSTATVRGPSIR